MLQCFSIKSLPSTSSIPVSPAAVDLQGYPPISHGNSPEGSPEASIDPSSNLICEYSSTFHTNSYNDMWSRIQILDPNEISHHNHDQKEVHMQVEHINGDGDPQQLLLSQVLQPNRQCVEEALRHARPSTLTLLVSTYFDHSENTTLLCLRLRQSIYRAHELYAPLHKLLDILPLDHYLITQSECDKAFEVFLQFNSFDNPFASSDAHNFHKMRSCFSELRQQLDRIQKSHSRVSLFRRAISGATLGVIGVASYFSLGRTKKQLAQVAQLDAAKKGTYVLYNYLDTIDRLIARLYISIEGDKQVVRFGLERDRDRHSTEEVLKQLRKDQLNFTHQLKDLEEHLCLCFNTVNRARSLLLQEVQLHQARSS